MKAIDEHTSQRGAGLECRECMLFALGRRDEGCADLVRWSAAVTRATKVLDDHP